MLIADRHPSSKRVYRRSAAFGSASGVRSWLPASALSRSRPRPHVVRRRAGLIWPSVECRRTPRPAVAYLEHASTEVLRRSDHSRNALLRRPFDREPAAIRHEYSSPSVVLATMKY